MFEFAKKALVSSIIFSESSSVLFFLSGLSKLSIISEIVFLASRFLLDFLHLLAKILSSMSAEIVRIGVVVVDVDDVCVPDVFVVLVLVDSPFVVVTVFAADSELVTIVDDVDDVVDDLVEAVVAVGHLLVVLLLMLLWIL